MDLWGEQLGQRTAGRFLPVGTTSEVDVGIDGEAYAGQHQLLRQHLLAIQTHRLGQAQPGLDTALLTGRTVVIEDALNPLAPGFAIRAVGEDRRILQRDVDLIVETIGHPALDLLAGSAPFVHGAMERVMDVIQRALGAQRLLEFGRCHGSLAHQNSPVRTAYKTMLMPSNATSMP